MYMYMCQPFGVLFREFWYSDRGVFATDEGTKSTFLGVFLYEIVKQVANGDKNMYSGSQNFEVQQAHPRTKFLNNAPGNGPCGQGITED